MSAKRIEMDTAPCPPQIPYPVSCLASSRLRMFYVLNYAPRMGWSGTTVSIDTLFYNIGWRNDVHIRIVIGLKPIPTDIEKIGDSTNLWRCTGPIPDFEVHKNTSTHSVAVTIQAVDQRNAILDSVTFGHFTYWEYGLPPPVKSEPGPPLHDGNAELHATPQATIHSTSTAQETRDKIPPLPVECQDTRMIPPEHYRRVLRRPGDGQGGHFKGVSLDFVTDPADLGKFLTKEERHLHRKLVRFLCKREGDTLRISFHPIRQEEYDERLVVISCIYRDDTCDTCYTSVDMIRLVEYIVQAPLAPEEKSRIRRNLEFLHPTTVSKTSMPRLFQTIMDFPTPKPRVIEKDIKVFQWDTLVAGLNKVLDKYSWVTIRQPSRAPSPLPPRRRPLLSGPGSPVSNFHGAPQLGCSPIDPFATPPSVDGVQAPNGLRQPQPNFVPALHVNPSWLHSQNFTIGSPAVGSGSLDLGGDPPNPRPCVPPAVSSGSQTPASGFSETFHHFDSLEFQTFAHGTTPPLMRVW
ncbi:hypothetical protein BJV78DRAFT_454549 [Lactifluus subvellereus]|nr:hypothetical protein BJV78DRAFT_454549 [Lactifluus subvellereus]